MGKIIYAENIFEESGKYNGHIQLDKIMKRLFTIQNKKPIIDFLNAIYNDNLSDDTIITYLNNEITTQDSFEKTIFESLYSDIRIKANDNSREFQYSIEFQTKEDKSIAIRLFKYSFNLAIQDIQKYENKIVINLPKPYVIVLEESRDVPDKYEFIMRLDEKELRYECNVLKYFEYDIEKLYSENMYLLFPIKIIEVRKDIRKIKYSKNITLDNPLIRKIRIDILNITEEILNYTGYVYDKGLITTTEYEEFGIIIENLVSYLNKEVDNIFDKIDKEIVSMVDRIIDPKVREKYKEIYREEGLREGREEGLREGLKEGLKEGMGKAKIEDARNLLKLGVSKDIIVSAIGLNENQVDELIEEISNEKKLN